jgi:putative redox protein
MDVSVTWSSGMSFQGTGPSGFSVPLGTDPSVGGADDGFRPMELMAISLASCTAMDVISILAKKREKVSAFEVLVHTKRHPEHPKVFTAAHIIYKISGNQVHEDSVRRAIELSVTKYCPSFAMLAQSFPIETSYEISQDTVDGGSEIVVKGVYSIA